MHAEALQWVSAQVDRFGPWRRVCEFGSRNINGSPRNTFRAEEYVGVDVEDGEGVDVVCDATSFTPALPFDAICCLEVAEHTEAWPLLIKNASRLLVPGGCFVFTAAGPGRAPHSAVDGGSLRGGEWYQNISPDDLTAALEAAGFVNIEVNQLGADVRAVAHTSK